MNAFVMVVDLSLLHVPSSVSSSGNTDDRSTSGFRRSATKYASLDSCYTPFSLVIKDNVA